MSADRIALRPGPFLTALRQEDNTRVGATSMVDFEGTQYECMMQQLYLRSLGASQFELSSKGTGMWVLHAVFPFTFDGQVTTLGVVPSIHELEINTAEINCYLNAKLRTLLSQTTIGAVQKIIRDYEAGLYPGTASEAMTAAEAAVTALTLLTGDTAGKALELFKMVAYMKTDSFIEEHSVYRRTLTAATPAQVTASYEGVGEIWTTAEVTAWEGLSSTFFVLPDGMQWYKSRPRVNAIAGQKTQLVYHYTECVTASELLYDAYGDAVLLNYS
jgi:hypothetical protein